MGKRTVLVADDNRAILETVNKALGETFEVLLAASGAEALEILKLRHPDLMLLDIDMPVMSGFELTREIKSRPGLADIPVVFISGTDDLENELMALNLGGVDYVCKPINPELLRRRCELHVELSTQTDLSFARMILDNAPFASALWSVERRSLVYVNNAVVSMLKAQDKANLMQNYHELEPKHQPDGDASFQATFEHLDEANSVGACDYAWTFRDTEGDSIPTWVSLRRLNINNEPYVISYIRDLRRENEAKRVLKDERDRLSAMFEASMVGFLVFSATKVLYRNLTAAQLFACLPGQPLREVFVDGGDYDALVAELQKEGTVLSRVARLRHKDGAERRYKLEAKISEFDDKPAAMLWLTDVEDICS